MIDRDSIQPSSHSRVTTEISEFAVSLQENVVRGIFSLAGVSQEAKRQIVNGLAMRIVYFREFRRGA